MNTSIISINNRQGGEWEYTEVRDYGNGNLLRVVIRKESSPLNCYARLEKWTTENGWKHFHSLNHRAEFWEFDHTQREQVRGVKVAVNYDPLYQSADELWRIAKLFLTRDMARVA
jgi:hypothetical protein